VPPEIKPLPPDHPLFTRGVSFVFQNELPEGETEQDESEPDHEDEG
jgi:hypothetical protein